MTLSTPEALSRHLGRTDSGNVPEPRLVPNHMPVDSRRSGARTTVRVTANGNNLTPGGECGPLYPAFSLYSVNMWGIVGNTSQDRAVGSLADHEALHRDLSTFDRLERPAHHSQQTAQLTPEGGTLAEGVEPCLYFFSPEAWQDQVERLLQLDQLRSEARDAQRKFFATAEECVFDRQGRITIPAHLRESAGIIKDVAVVGVGTKIEIWQLEGWRHQKASIDAGAPDIFERASRLPKSPT